MSDCGSGGQAGVSAAGSSSEPAEGRTAVTGAAARADGRRLATVKGEEHAAVKEDERGRPLGIVEPCKEGLFGIADADRRTGMSKEDFTAFTEKPETEEGY